MNAFLQTGGGRFAERARGGPAFAGARPGESIAVAPAVRRMLDRCCVRLAARGCWLAGLAIVCVILMTMPRGAQAQSSASASTLERRVKAAFLYKFLAYTEFPPAAFADPAAPAMISAAAIGAASLTTASTAVAPAKDCAPSWPARLPT